MLRLPCMRAGVLGRRGVAAADMAALRASAQVEPPPAGCVALDAPRSARRDRRVDTRDGGHPPQPSVEKLGEEGLLAARVAVLVGTPVLVVASIIVVVPVLVAAVLVAAILVAVRLLLPARLAENLADH